MKQDPMPPLQVGRADVLRADAEHRPAAASANAAARGVPAVVLGAMLVGTLVCIGIACVVCRSFYGDGAYVVLGLLRTPMEYNDYDFHRSFASYIGQTPVLFGERLGIVNVSAYGGLYSFAVNGIPLLAYVIGLALARNAPRLFTATALALAVFGFGANFTNSEGNLFMALAWLAGVVLALPGPRRFARGIALPALAFVLLRTYEGMVLAGPILAIWSYAKAARTDDADERIGLVPATLLFAIAGLIGFSGYVAPRDPGNAASFSSAMFLYLRNPQMWLLLAAVCVLVAVLVSQRAFALGMALVAIALAVIFFASMLGQQDYYAYRIYYQNRAFLVLLLPVALAALAVADLYGRGCLARGVAPARMLALLVPFAAVVAVDLLGSVRWFAYMNTFCDVLARPGGASAGIAQLKASGAVTGWPWTHPSLSLLLRDHRSRAIVLNDTGKWQPFDSAQITLTAYRGACENRRFGASRHAVSP